MKSSKLSLAIAAVLAGASGVAVGVPFGEPGGVFYYAEELVSVENATQIKLPNPFETTLGSAVPANAARYLRIDLTGLKFDNDNDGYDDKTAMVSAGTIAVTFSSGAGVGGTHAIFSITAGGSSIPSTTPLTINLTHDELALTGANPTLQYRVFETETCANNPNNSGCGSLYDSNPKPIVALRSGITFDVDGSDKVVTATVNEDYKKFKLTPTGTSTAADGGLGGVKLGAASGVRRPDNGLSVSVSDILGSGTKVTVKGDFSAAAQVWLDTSACNTGNTSTDTNDLTGAISADKQSATFSIGTRTSAYNLCFVADGSTPIPVSGYAADLVPAAASGANISKIVHLNKPMGTIKRDGVILRSGFVSKFGIGVSRFIFANTGSQDANITSVRFFGNRAGETVQPTLKATLPIVLKANSRTAIELADLVDLASMPLQNMMVEFNIGAQDDNIFGTYQLLLAGSTVQTVVPLERTVSAIK